MPIRIEPLTSRHARGTFSCGRPELDDWFKQRASQDERRNIARVFIANDDALGIVGFYCLSSFTLAIDDLPPELGRKLPRYGEIPAALVGRLARDQRVRGQGIGELLLADAIRRILSASRTLAVFATVVDAKDEQAGMFYQRYGFRPFPRQPQRLFLTTATASAAALRA